MELEEVVPAGGLADGLLDRHPLHLDVLQIGLIVDGDPEQDLQDEPGPVGYIEGALALRLPGDDVCQGEELLQTDCDDGRVGDRDGERIRGELLAVVPPLPCGSID